MNRASLPGSPPYRLNVGCGRNIIEHWINLDSVALPGVDLVVDLEKLRVSRIDLPDDSVGEFLLSHVIEHVHDALGLMQELWRLAVPGAVARIRVPHGGNDRAWEDPTHIRPYFLKSFGFFSQPFYWRADYGYRGDWQPEKIQLLVERKRFAGLSTEDAYAKIQNERNAVLEMICETRAIKPIREPKQELIVSPDITIVLAN